ncbi:MAG: 50S ribosomal protein L15 [Pseudomonadota bacterium]|nr:50S ribosomal protein L15 [Gammaproteobacteria bacterium]MEC9285427.1 50S ribosomal protein L15 [Pseudomonadota bacterium]HBP14426.1 50S ribosomal protein L15 [Gammaproteobacteria bacterium]HCP50193.1 50S ribosomal protein L15 [Gammaproteobacteria bacterium]
MKLNDINPRRGSRKQRKRLGRGISAGQGKTCGRGHKGQKSRSGGKVRIGFEGGQLPLQRRVPRFGFRSRIGAVTAEVRIGELDKVTGDEITLESLKSANILSKDVKRARVFQSGEIHRALTIKGLRVTRGARAAIKKAGGTIVDES